MGGGIFLTNAVGDSERDVSSVYSLGSRFNHSCRPNAIVAQVGGMRCFFAMGEIAQGEEICISYIEDYTCPQHTALRAQVQSIAPLLDLDPQVLLVALFRQQLFVKWGFWCECCRCAPVAAAADEAL